MPVPPLTGTPRLHYLSATTSTPTPHPIARGQRRESSGTRSARRSVPRASPFAAWTFTPCGARRGRETARVEGHVGLEERTVGVASCGRVSSPDPEARIALRVRRRSDHRGYRRARRDVGPARLRLVSPGCRPRCACALQRDRAAFFPFLGEGEVGERHGQHVAAHERSGSLLALAVCRSRSSTICLGSLVALRIVVSVSPSPTLCAMTAGISSPDARRAVSTPPARLARASVGALRASPRWVFDGVNHVSPSATR